VQELLQQIDLNYYRSAQLLIVHAELEQLRRESAATADFDRRTGPRIDNRAEVIGLAARPGE
jgi:hypothetical protein